MLLQFIFGFYSRFFFVSFFPICHFQLLYNLSYTTRLDEGVCVCFSVIFLLSVFECCKIFGWKCHSQIQFLNEGGKTTRTLSRVMSKNQNLCLCVILHSSVTFQQNKPMFSLVFFLLLSKIAFRVLPRDQNFFYITFFVVNATVVLLYFLLHAYLFLSRCFWIFKFPIRSQKLICLMCVWLVFVPLKLLRLFTEKKKIECFDFSQCRTPFGLTLDAVQILTVLASVSNQWDFTGVPHVFLIGFRVSVCRCVVCQELSCFC